MAWYYYSENGKEGPFNARTIKDLALEGIIQPETILENSQGKKAHAQSVEGLVFPTPVAVQEVIPIGTPAVPEAEAFQEETPAESPLGEFPFSESSPTEDAENGEDGSANFHVSEKKPSVRIKLLKPGFWDYDLARILGDPGTEVNLALLKNVTNLLKVTYWFFCIIFWLYVIGGMTVIIGMGGEEKNWGVILPAILIFLLSCIAFFFFRLYLKLPIELLKYFMYSCLTLKRIEQELKNR